MSKPKILLVIDKPNWAYDQIAKFIINELNGKYDFYKEYQMMAPRTLKDKILHSKFLLQKHLNRKVSDNYDLVVYLWWWSPQILKEIPSRKKLIGIFTEGFPPGYNKNVEKLEPQKFIDKYIKPVDGIIAGNKNIEILYKNFDLPVYYATGAVDTSLFKYNKKSRKDTQLRVCWTGNPGRNFKGFYDFVVPAIKLAQKQRSNIELVTRFSGSIQTLPEFYSQVDIMVNASVGDAGPFFITDAGACGIPTISTNSGFATEIIRDRVNGMIVERDIEKIADKLIEVYDDRELLESMSQNISKDINDEWGYKSRARYWDYIFSEILEVKT